MINVVINIRSENETISTDSYVYDKSMEYIYEIQKQANIKIEEYSNCIIMNIECASKDIQTYKTIRECYKEFSLYNLVDLSQDNVVKVSLMYYYLTNFSKKLFLKIKEYNKGEEYIKYLEKKNEIEKYFSSDSNEGNLKFLTVIFAIIIVASYIFNIYIGTSMIVLYIIGAIWAYKTDRKSEKERIEKKNAYLNVIESLLYLRLFEKEMKK